ncbi:hypothetical protein DESUT3_14070 [Desulfuromonas versatilis]|uniref:Uncharacterized protein n=1 Tax=Desulfuromonas versatilis TaxID=2802975 RepID=A0ABM8HNE5_9BACT|nr:hypothetical protein DESUT3_14070 [Desulfuromonas versatilis]
MALRGLFEEHHAQALPFGEQGRQHPHRAGPDDEDICICHEFIFLSAFSIGQGGGPGKVRHAANLPNHRNNKPKNGNQPRIKADKIR